jgi:glycerophosphoryl diester phosphodiesterase
MTWFDRLVFFPPVVALLAIIGLVVGVIGPAPATATAPANVTCIAHRGGDHWSPAHTEETAATYAAAITAGVPEVEGDARFTSTGYPYLLHDATLGLFGHSSTTLAAVSGTVATGPTYVSATGDQLLSLYSLREMLKVVPTRLQLELKTTLTEPNWVMLASRLDPIKDKVTITSFNPDTVQAAQEHGYRTGYLSSTFSESTEAPTWVQDFATLEPDDVALHAARGVATQTWTIDTANDWDAAAAAGVTGIITNDPAACMVWAAS